MIFVSGPNFPISWILISIIKIYFPGKFSQEKDAMQIILQKEHEVNNTVIESAIFVSSMYS